MKNKFSKFINLQGKYLTSLLILLALSIGYAWGAYDVPAFGTYTIKDAGKVNNAKRFNLVGTGVYHYRNSSNYSWDSTNGLKTQNTDGGVVFYLNEATWIKVTIYHAESKNAHDITVKIINLTDEVYGEFDDHKSGAAESNRTLTSDVSTTADSTFTISLTATIDDFSGTKKLAAGRYAIIAQGAKGNTFFKSIEFIPTLTWNFDGGSTSAIAGDDYTAGGPVPAGTTLVYPENSTMTKGGASFSSWSSSATTMPASNLTITAQWAASGATQSNISYANTKGADVSALPTTYYEGTGVASFDALADVTNFHFTSWTPASIAADATGDQEITANWVAAYNVSFSAGDGSGTVPASFQKWEGATFELPGQGSMVAPEGKAFDGWKIGDTKFAAGEEYTMGNTAAAFVALWKKAATVIFDWSKSGNTGLTESPTDLSSATYGTLTTGTSISGIYNEKALAHNTKGYKIEENAAYFEIQGTSAFEEGDTVIIQGVGGGSGERGFSVGPVSSTDAIEDTVRTNLIDESTNTSVYKVVLTTTQAGTKLHIFRMAGKTMYLSSIKVIRPAKYDVIFAAGEGASGSMATKQYPKGAEVTLPECTFTAPSGKEFNVWTSTDVTISSGKFTMIEKDVTITATWKDETPKYDVTYNKGEYGSGTIDPAKKIKDVALTLSSERFTRAGYLQTGWATTDGGTKAYDLGGSYTENDEIVLYPVWTELDTYVAAFACGDAAPAGWTFANAGTYGDGDATVDYVCKFVENGTNTPKQDGKTDDDMVAFAKNTSAVATYDLGITTTVAGLNVTLYGGSSGGFDETIELVGADGTTVKQSYVTNLNAGNWNGNNISKTDVVADVRYIKVHGASKWVVMSAFSVQYIETRTKYDVAFAAGTGASGSMATLHYIEGAEVALPACTFTAPTEKEFDKWQVTKTVGGDALTVTGGKFIMPAENVTATATWKDLITRFDVTFETNGGSTITKQEIEENGHPTAVANPTKDNYVFAGWFNNSDLAPEHAVADITALTITENITLFAKWQLDIRLRQLVFSNGFDAFIKNNEVKAYYMAGTSAPTMVSYQGVNLKDVADAVTIVGNKVRMIGTDDSVIELDLILEAVTPMSSYDKQIFDGTETYVKTGNEFSTTSGKLGWKFSKNDNDWTRETPGQNRIYFFVRGGADKVTFTSGGTNRAIKVYVNNVLVPSVEGTAAAGSTFDIPLPAANEHNMIAIVSNQTNGDGSMTDMKLNEHVISTDVSLASLTVNGTAIDLQDGVYTYNFELPYGTVDAPTVVAVANAAPYATVSAITVDGTTKATFTVTAESSATQDYVVNFSIARFPTIYLWDGSTMTQMSDITAAATAAGVSITTTGISVTSFSAITCEENGKSYTKALDFGGNTKSSRYFGIEIPDGKVAKVSLVYKAKSTGARSIIIGTALTGVVDESAITSVACSGDASKLHIMTADMFGGGTLYINTSDGFHVHEISIQLADGHARSAMLGAGVFGTVCVPNNVAIEDIQGVTVYELMGRENTYGKLAFDEIISGELEAGAPYVFQAHRNHMALLYGEDHVSDPVYKGNGMYGTFGDITLTELTDVYYFAQRALWGCGDLTSLSVPANRAYVKLSEIDYITDPNPAPGRRRVLFGVNGEQTATAIDNLNASEKPVKLLIDGQLFIIRGEKMFDATGRLVK